MLPEPSRIEPHGPAAAYKTYEIHAPRSTHWRSATCAEVDCTMYMHGWRTVVPAGSDLAELARRSGRRHVETQREGGLVEFVFEAGQPCFAAGAHRVRSGMPEVYVVRGGDWRGNPRGEFRKHRDADDWVEDFAEHQQHIADAIERG